MSDTSLATPGLEPETRVRIRGDIFDARAAELGARTETERAQLLGITRNTLYRWRKGCLIDHGRALRVASRLQLDVGNLFDQLDQAA